jgi:hypothetical protein
MKRREWSDREIEERSGGVAAELRKAAARARNEAELRLGVNPILVRFAVEAGVEVDERHERLVGRGRADSVFGRVVIEYEPPGSLSDRSSAAANRGAVKQVQDYLADLAKEERQDLGRMVGVVLDGAKIIFVRQRRGDWEVGQPREVDAASVADLLLRLRALRGKALLPENLVREFGGVEARGKFTASDTAARCVSALYQSLARSESPKVEALFGQWRLLFSEVCGYEFASAKLDLEGLAGSYGVTLTGARRVGGTRERTKAGRGGEAERLFFCIHTYYATVITLLAAEIVTYYMSTVMPSYLGKLEGMSGARLRDELRDLHERGGLFGEVGVGNFLEGDFFGWYLEAWDEQVAGALAEVVRGLRGYDPATFQVEPDETRDLLKKLYQYLLPKKLRHDLGEYYTPDWLAELVLEEVGYDGDLTKRILDPACGSGTFPVLEIKRAKEWAREHFRGERETLEGILAGIVGFDLNPLAVITARTNYLIALGDLLRHRRGPIEIPVYLCDAVLTPTEAGQLSLVGRFGRRYPVETAVGTLQVPVGIATQHGMSALARVLEEGVRGQYRTEEFLKRARGELGLTAAEFAEAEGPLAEVYGRLRQVDAEGRNGIWARIIKNFFAPVFTVAKRKFDYLAGNLPWINWESLPDGYRRRTVALWQDYRLVGTSGRRAGLGSVKRDIAMLFLYVAADRYLAEGGVLGFLVTETVLKSGAGERFRRFELPAAPGQRPVGLGVRRAHDLVNLKPFEGAANRTAVVVLQKGRQTEYPVPYVVWRKRRDAKLQQDATLGIALRVTTRDEGIAKPISDARGAPWMTGPARPLEAAQKVTGRASYVGRAGTSTWLNGVYWVKVRERMADGSVAIDNLHAVGRIGVREVTARVEAELLYPLLRGRDVESWHSRAGAWILLLQDPGTGKAYAEAEVRVRWPLAYAYIKRFERDLRRRSGYRLLFKPSDPFYSLGNVGPHTFAQWKVAWREVATGMDAAVCGPVGERKSRKAVIADHTVITVACELSAEAHYICALLNSAPSQMVIEAYLHLHASPHVLEHVKIPRFGPKSKLHGRLAELSEAAHEAAARDDQKRVAGIEAQVDEAAAELWGLTARELDVIQKALRDKKRGRH